MGGLIGVALLVPLVWLLTPTIPALGTNSLLGLLWLSLIGAALTYILWFRGLTRLDTAVVSSLGFLSPLTAVILSWIVLDERLSIWQMSGVMLVLASIWWGQRHRPSQRKG